MDIGLPGEGETTELRPALVDIGSQWNNICLGWERKERTGPPDPMVRAIHCPRAKEID